MMKRIFAVAIVIAMSAPALRADDVAQLKQEIRLLKEQLGRLEQKLNTQAEKTDRLQASAQMVEEKALQMEEDSLSTMESFAQLKEVNDRIAVSGNIDIVGFYANVQNGEPHSDVSDILVDQVKLNLDIDVTDNVGAFVGLQFEDYRLGTYAGAGTGGAADDTGLDSSLQIDEVYITLGAQDAEDGWYSSWGKQYMPFGDVDEFGHFINDSLARQLSETKDTGGVIGYRQAGMEVNAFGLNSTANSGSQNIIETFGGSVAFCKQEEDMSLKVGAGYINNLYAARNSTGGLLNYATATVVPIPAPATWTKELPAYNLFMAYETGPFWFHGEYTGTLTDADPSDDTLASTGDEDVRPAALSLEAAVTVPVNDRDVTFAGKYENNDNQDAFGVPIADVWGFAVETEIAENTTLRLNFENQQSADLAGVGHTDWYGAELRVRF